MNQFELIYFFHFILQNCLAQNLVAVEASAKLPQASYRQVAIYNGGENIFIFGGSTSRDGSESIDAIYAYNIEQDNISIVANFPTGIYGGLASFDKNGNAYYIGGYLNGDTDNNNNVFKLDINTLNVSVVGQLSKDYADGTAINSLIDENKTLQFSGRLSEVGCFDYNTILRCGNQTLIGAYRYGLAAFEHNGYVYAFGDNNDLSVEKINLETLESELLQGFHEPLYYPAVVTDGTFGYVIGGYYTEDTGIAVDGIIRYEPQINEHTFLKVDNFPVNGTDRWYSKSAVYVPKLDRIYVIGGNLVRKPVDGIWYIDLYTFSAKKTNGTLGSRGF